MEPEDLPWPGELEEEEEEEEEEEVEVETAAAAEEAAEEATNSAETVMVEEVEEEAGPELDSDFNYMFQARESTDDEEDDEAKAWLEAHPGRVFPPLPPPPPPPPRHRYSQDERTSPGMVVPLTCRIWPQPYLGNVRRQISDTNAVSLETTAQWGSGDDQRAESWHSLPQEMDSSQTLDTTQTRINMRVEGTEVTDFPSLEEGVLTQSKSQVKEPNRDLLCSPLLVIQDSFASPDLPLLTCLTQDQEFGPDSLFHQSDLDFAPLRGIPDKSEDTEWFSRPSEVSEALFQATSEVSSDLVNSCFSISQHPLTGSTTVGSQCFFLPPEQGNNEENVSSNVNKLKTPKDSDNYDAFCSYMSQKTRKDIQQPESNLADKDQVSVSTLFDISDENIATKRNDSFDAPCSHVQYWKQEALQQAETCPITKDCVSFPHEVAPPCDNKMSYSFLRCSLERRGKGVPLTSDSQYFENPYLRVPADSEVKQKMDSLEGCERNEDLQKELSQYFEQKETRNNLVPSEVHSRSSEIKYIGNVVVPDNSVQVSEAHILSRGHDLSKMEASGGPLWTVKSSLDETSEQLYFQEERNQKATSSFGEKNVNATENVAFEAVIASIEPSKKESTVSEIQTDLNKSIIYDSQEQEPQNPDLSPLSYNGESSFIDKLKHPNYQSTPGVFEPAAVEPLLHKEDDDDSSLYWHSNLKSPPNTPQKLLIKLLSVIPELKSSASLSEKSYTQAVGLGKTQSALFQCDIYSEPFLPIGKVKSVSALELAEKVSSSNIIYSMKVSTSDSLILQDLKQQTFEEVADSSDYNVGKDVNSSNIIEGPPAAIGSSFSANLVACDAKSRGALPLTGAASLIAVGQETLLKADVGQGEIPWLMRAKSSFPIHTVMQNDSYFVAGLQGKAESDVITLDGDTECCSRDEKAVVCSERVAELQRETCNEHDLTGEYIELAALENLLDDLCDSSLNWQPTLQLPSEKESNFEKPVGHSNQGINQPFSSVLPPFVPHEPTRESEYHSSNLRMLRVSPDTVPKTLKRLSGGTSKGGIAEIAQSKLKSGIATTPGDSDIGSHLSSSLENLPQLPVTSSQENTIGQHTDILNQKILADGHLTEESLKVSHIPESVDQKTGISTAPSASYSHREEPIILYREGLPGGHLTGQSLTVSAVTGPADQKAGTTTIPSATYSQREKLIISQQALPDSYLTGEALKVSPPLGPADQNTGTLSIASPSYSQREEPNILYQEGLPDGLLTDQALTVSAAPGPADQETGIPTVTSTSYSRKDKPGIFYQQALPGSHLPEQTLKAAVAPRPADQQTGVPTVTSTSYSQKDKPGILYQQALPGSHLPKETLKAVAAPRSADQQTGVPTVTSSYLQRDKPAVFYQQALPGSHLPEQTLKDAAAPKPVDQQTGIPSVTSTSYSYTEEPGIFYQQELPESPLTEESLKVSAASGPGEQKTGIATVSSTSYSHGEKSHTFDHQALPQSHLSHQALKISAVSGSADQKVGTATVPSTSSSHGVKPGIFYQQELSDSHQSEETLKVSPAPGPADQKTGAPTVHSGSYSQTEKPGIFSQQTLPGSRLVEEALKVSAVSGSADQKTWIPTVTSISDSHKEASSIFYQQTSPDSHLTEEALQVSVVPGPGDQKTGIPSELSGFYSHREKPIIFSQQTLPGSHQLEEALKVPADSGSAEQKAGVPAVSSSSHSHREKPSVFYQQELPESHPTEKSSKVLVVVGPADQKPGISAITSSSYSHREKPIISYQQTLPDSYLPEEAFTVSSVSGPAEQIPGIPTVTSASYSYNEKPSIFYQQKFPDSHLTEDALKVSGASGPADQKTGTPTVSSTSYSQREKPGIFYQQTLPDSHLTEETLKVSAPPGPADQKTGIATVTSTSYSQRDKPDIFYRQTLLGSHIPGESLKASAAPGPANQKTGTPAVSSGSYSPGEKSIIFYQHTLPDSPLTKEALEVSAISGPAEQKTGTPAGPSGSYSVGEKSIISYQQDLSSSYLPKEALKVVASAGPVDLKTEKPTVSSTSYSFGEKPIVLYQQALPDIQLSKEGLRVSVVPGPVDQNSGIPTITSSAYSNPEKTIVSYQQELADSHLTEKAVKVSIVPGPSDQKTGILIVPATTYSHTEQPNVSYQQEFPDLSEKALKVLDVLGPAEQKTGIRVVSSTPYSHREQPVISYQQEFPDLAEEALKVLGVPGLSNQKTGIHIVPSTHYSHEEKPIISYQQKLPDHTEVALKTLGVPGPTDQKTGIQIASSGSYLSKEKPSGFHQQELPNASEEALDTFVLPGPVDQKIGISTEPSSYYSHREKASVFPQQEFPVSHFTKEPLKVSPVSILEQKTGTPAGPFSSYFHREKPSDLYQQPLPDSDLTEESTVPGLVDQNRRPIVPSSSYSYKEKLRISPVSQLDDQKSELPTATHSSYLQKEKPKISTVIGPGDQKTPLLTVFHSSYPQRVKPGILFQQQLPDRDQSEDILKISAVPKPTDLNTGIPVPSSGSYLHGEKSNSFYPQELPDRHLTEDTPKVSTVPERADQKTVLLTAPPSSFSQREKRNILYQKDLPDRHLTEDALRVSSGLGQAEQITGLPITSPRTYLPSPKHTLVSEHIQSLIDNLNSSDSSVSSNNMPLPSQADDGAIISMPESSGFGDVGSEEIRDTESCSKTLKEIRTLLMEAENIALKRCNFPAPLVPFRDVSDVSFVQSKKVVCFKEPSTTNVSNDLLLRQPLTGESPSNGCVQKDIGTQTNLKCHRGIENWEFISSTTIRSPLQEAESKARVTLDETFRQYKAAKSVMRSEPEGCSGTIGNKVIIPMMTIIKSDSSSDASDGNGSCSWDSNLPESLESVSDVLLNFFPYASPKTSIADSREEEGVSESEDGCGSVDSLAAHVKNLLQCESSLNHARQILRDAEEEECRVRARAWNLKFNLGHECGYSISELNEDDRRKVEEIKAKLFGHGRATDLSEGLQSPPGIGCTPEALCSHIIIESHEKGCFRTLTAEQPQLDSHPCVFRPAEPSEVIRGRRSPSPWRARHINLSKSLDQNNPHFRVWNSLQLQSHSPFKKLTPHDFKVSKGVQMPFSEKMDPWLSELVEPACLLPKEVDFHSSQILPPEPMKQFTTSITFSSHQHSKCISDSSVFKVGVTEGSQSTGVSVGVFNSHVTEEQNSPRDLKQKTSCPSSLKNISHSPDKEVTISVEANSPGQKLAVDFEHSHQEEKLLERSNVKVSHSKPSISANCSNFKEVHFSDNHTLISMGKPSSTLGVKEKNVTITPDLPSHIFLEQRELFEQNQAPHTEHYVKEHHSPPCPNLPSCIFLEQRELFEQSKAPHVDHEMRENPSLFHRCQDYIPSDLPSPIFLEHPSKASGVDDHMRKYHFLLSQGQDCVVEKNQHTPKSHISNMINVEAKFNNVISQLAPDPCTLATSSCTPPSNRKALSCVRITLCPKTSSKMDSGTLDKRFHLLDSASKTRINSEFNSDLQTICSRSLEPTSKLLTSKPIAQNQESLDFLGPKSPLDLQVIQSPLLDSNTIDLKTIPSQNSQIVTSRQTQVNISDLEGYSKPEGTPVSADGSQEQSKIPFSASSGKLSSDAVTQITTESPEKTMFSSEIFINGDDHRHEILEPSTQKPHKVPVKFPSSSSVQQVTTSRGTDAQPVLLPYKPPGSVKMYYVPQLQTVPSLLDSKSDTTIESSHSGSNDAIAPDFPAQVLGTRDDDLSGTVNIKHKEGIYSKRAVTKAPLSVGKKPFHKDNAEAPVQVPIIGDETLSDKKKKEEIFSQRVVTKTTEPEEKESLQKDTAGSSDATAAEHSAKIQDTETGNIPDTKAIEQKEEILFKRTIPKEAWTKEEESLQIDISESECHSEFENTTHSVFRSAKFYFHHPVHLSNDQDFCHESLGRSVFMRHSWKDFFQHHSDKHKEHTCLPPPFKKNVDTTKMDYTRIKSLSINLNLGDNEVIPATKSQARDHLKSKRQINDPKRDHKVTPEVTSQHTVSLNELWNKYQERQRQQKQPDVCDRKELSLVERLDRLAKILQNPITHSLQASESTQDDSRGARDVKEWSGKQLQQKSKLQKQKRYKSLEKGCKNIGDLKKNKVLSPSQSRRSNQIKIEQFKFDKYILRKQPNFNYTSNTSSDSRPSEESELLTDTPTNILSTTTSPVDSDILTQTDREVALHERSSSISTIDTARLIQAFGHERVCLSPRRIKLYSSVTNQQRRYLEKRCKHNKKVFSTGHSQMSSEPARRRHIQVANHMISSDSVSSASSFLSLNSTLCNKQNVYMLNKGVQAGNLEIVNGAKKHTRDVGVTFPTPSSSETRLEEDSDVTSCSEERIEEKMLFTNSLGGKKLRKNKQNSYEGISWFVPVENGKSESKKENLPKVYGPGISWFEPIAKTKPWREPLREQNWQGQRMDGRGPLGGPGGDDGQDSLRPFVRTTLQESLHLHRPDFISRSGERIKRLKLIVQERKLQNMFQSERNELFNAMNPLPKRVFLAAQKNKPIGKKEMIQRSKRIYEQLPEVQKKREEEKRKSEYKSYRLRAQLYKKKVTNQLLGRKVPWD